MDFKHKNEIEKLLNGKCTVEQAQRLLAEISEDDLKKLIPEEKLAQMTAEYKGLNNYIREPVPNISENKIEEIWKSILSRAERPEPFSYRITEWLKVKLNSFLSSFSETPFNKYGIAIAATAVILIMLPVTFKLGQHTRTDYSGIKGETVKQKAVLQFAIVGPDKKLHRPDRVLTEQDTLAFRVDVESEGYCSIYVICRNQVDKVITDQFMLPEVHDLNVGYSLSGNRGNNIIVMLFADAPISIEEKEKQKLIFESAQNKVTSMTIRKNIILFHYQEIEVR